MARPGRPMSESYQPISYSVSQSASYSAEAQEDGDDQTPIFSLSKSSMDVVMAHKRDPAWTRLDLRRSSSTNTHSDQNAVTLQQLHPHVWQHVSAASSHQQALDAHGHPALSERWITNMHRWSGSTLSRSSTPDTVVWKGGTSRPSSLTQETPWSPMSKTTSPTTTPSAFISPLQTPTSPPDDPFSSPTLSITHQQDYFLASSPLPSPLQAHASSPLTSNSPDLLQPASTEDKDFLENNSLFFRFPSPIPSSASLAGEEPPSDPKCLTDDVMAELHRPGGTQLSEGGEVRGTAQTLNYMAPDSPADGQEGGRGATVCCLELPWEPGQSCPTGRAWRSPLVSSLSDSLLGDRSNLNTTKAEVLKEEGTMTSQLELVDAAVQTSPFGSLWGLRRNTSNVGSHSFLGSPPGSRLNLKSSVGSNSNLVSPSSSMFPASSGDEEEAAEEECQGDDPSWDSVSLHNQERRRRRSCLKMKMIQGEERNEMGRRSSMKQVQWDEDGMTWDIHGASQDLEVLSTAIQKHLGRQNSPKPLRPSSKKKKAPKPPLISNVVKAMTPELHPPVTIITSTCATEGESEKTPEGVRKEAGEETVDAGRRLSRAEAAYAKEEDEVYREEGGGRSGLIRKRSGIRSLRRPGWCGGSSKADD